MKNKKLKFTIPFVVFAAGLIGAMQTNKMDKKATTLVNRWGYTHLEGQNCAITNVMCTVGGGSPCKQGTTLLYDFVSTVSCPNPLSKLNP